MVEDEAKLCRTHSWIDESQVGAILSDLFKVISAVDGSEQSMRGFEWALQGPLLSGRDVHLTVLHVFDPTKDYLPPKRRRAPIQSTCENLCTSYLLPSKYFYLERARFPGRKIATQVCEIIEEKQASFITMGFQGKPQRKDLHIVGSNVMEVMQLGKCSVVIFRTEVAEELPLKRPTKFVVSVGPNKAATKAFLDALKLSKPGDEIRVVYVPPFLENAKCESKASKEIRTKYDEVIGLLTAGGNSSVEAFKNFGGRSVELVFTPQGRNETIAQALNRYATNWEADFVLVGTNALRAMRGKPTLGSVSLQICMEFEGNVVVSYYNDSAVGPFSFS
jgi:nucleotide-binding universal stress UspA family protein